MENFKLINTNYIPTTATTQTAHAPELRHEMMYNFKCRYRRELYLKSGTATEKFRENGIESGLVPFYNNSQNCPKEIQERSTYTKASCKGDGNFVSSNETGPQIEGVLVRDESSYEI